MPRRVEFERDEVDDSAECAESGRAARGEQRDVFTVAMLEHDLQQRLLVGEVVQQAGVGDVAPGRDLREVMLLGTRPRRTSTWPAR